MPMQWLNQNAEVMISFVLVEVKQRGLLQNIEILYVMRFEFRNRILVISTAPSPRRHRFKTAYLTKDYSAVDPPGGVGWCAWYSCKNQASGRGQFIWVCAVKNTIPSVWRLTRQFHFTPLGLRWILTVSLVNYSCRCEF